MVYSTFANTWLRKPNKKEVVMSSFTIFDLVNMVICSGAKPVFIDHEKDSFDMNTKNLVSYIEKNHNKLHLFYYVIIA